jgi:hypothetical protein
MYTCQLNVHGVRVGIKARQPEKIHRLESLYGLFLVPSESEPETEPQWIDEDELDLLSFLARHDIFAFHAAAYENGNGKGILLPGRAASGKTTIAFSALSSGYPFVGDDVALCRQDKKGVRLLPFKSYLSLKQGEENRIYHVLEHYPKDVFCSTYAQVIVFPRIVGEEQSDIRRISEKGAVFLGLLGTAVWVREKVFRRRQASILGELCTLPAYNLFLGNDHKRRPEVAIDLLDRI